MKKIGVYGSLRAGMYNHDLLNNSQLVETKTVSVPFKMVSFGMYPALIPDEQNHNVVFEIYNVDNEVYSNVEILEGYPDFYQKALQTNDGFEYYFVPDVDRYYRSRFMDEEHISDWVEYMKK